MNSRGDLKLIAIALRSAAAERQGSSSTHALHQLVCRKGLPLKLTQGIIRTHRAGLRVEP